MKKITILWLFVTILVMSCQKEELATPVASFHLSKVNFGAGEAIEVENLSLNSHDFKWECGPKTYKTNRLEKFMFVLLDPGTYTLRLTATNGPVQSVKEAQITITPKPVTTLRVKTIYENGASFPGCTINIYTSYDDFMNSQNSAYTSKTNSDGIFEIKNINVGTYWFDAFYIVNDENMYLNWYQGGIYSIEVKKDELNAVKTILKLFETK